jgi:oligopeptide/dipeptide ABC transporter ATP-binding protein
MLSDDMWWESFYHIFIVFIAGTTALLSAVPQPDPRSERTRERIILKGDLPSPINPPAGCVFNTRCWKAQDICRSKTPELLTVGKSQVACHFPE